MRAVKPPTTLPCPAWCIYSAAHDFEVDGYRPGLWRRHDHPVRWLQWSHTGGGMPALSVWMSQVEQAAAIDGPFLTQPVEIVIEGCADTQLTGPQARQLAAALTDAADLWDAANRVSLSALGS